jgi:hypothetical protein
MFDPKQVSRSHLSGDARKQSTTLANTACYGVLSKRLTALVPAAYDHYKAFLFSSLAAMFHTV